LGFIGGVTVEVVDEDVVLEDLVLTGVIGVGQTENTP